VCGRTTSVGYVNKRNVEEQARDDEHGDRSADVEVRQRNRGDADALQEDAASFALDLGRTIVYQNQYVREKGRWDRCSVMKAYEFQRLVAIEVKDVRLDLIGLRVMPFKKERKVSFFIHGDMIPQHTFTATVCF
jgi:hypothetical protein